MVVVGIPAEGALHDPALRHVQGHVVVGRLTDAVHSRLSSLARWGIRVAGLCYCYVIHVFPSVRHLSGNVIDHGKEDNLDPLWCLEAHHTWCGTCQRYMTTVGHTTPCRSGNHKSKAVGQEAHSCQIGRCMAVVISTLSNALVKSTARKFTYRPISAAFRMN